MLHTRSECYFTGYEIFCYRYVNECVQNRSSIGILCKWHKTYNLNCLGIHKHFGLTIFIWLNTNGIESEYTRFLFYKKR